jgi:hypothetical protein
MDLNGPDEQRTQKPLGSHRSPYFEKTPGFRKNHASGVQGHFEAANDQVFLPDLPAPSNKILEKLAGIRPKTAAE